MSTESGADGRDATRTGQLDKVRIARELTTAISGLPPAEVPDALCRACMDLLPEVSGVSASIALPELGTSILLFASDEVASLLAETQFTLGEGPCVQALRLGHPVFATDLTRGLYTRRWPFFTAQAVQTGAEAVFSLPLAHPGGALGTLDLYRKSANAKSTRLLGAAAPLVAEVLALMIGALGDTSAEAFGDAMWPGAKRNAGDIHLAIGMIMTQMGVNAQQALLVLRARAFAQDRTCTDVAREIVNRTMDITCE
ncbi:GAF and ANTAR domain-containing protein [Streptomyces griseorubiginosus]|uniref:GAF and ANTAR domain-containing protein n=1 Tax=Streptomyces griseorubiginosus TaxID=67304 RepID=UPI00114000EB|nr:GAF and ANTAR domain-containing protein [Streptomyces griseorubiginosus]